ncbi:hypothetical protein BK009_07965 [Methanobacterium subterraneum]|uniref:Uncharacterized protein n=1 Tax=Methanobacterium subterraneum TaxID=59277 RepID=A0A2H4VR88_9EURY|nr:hypothetical protein BK009_07965 [Methanobacterium subterraneum]
MAAINGRILFIKQTPVTTYSISLDFIFLKYNQFEIIIIPIFRFSTNQFHFIHLLPIEPYLIIGKFFIIYVLLKNYKK